MKLQFKGTIQKAERKTDRKTNYGVVTYFDLDSNGIRCFRGEKLLNAG